MTVPSLAVQSMLPIVSPMAPAAQVSGGLAAADIWHRLMPSARMWKQPLVRGLPVPPEKLADLIAEDKLKLAGYTEVVIDDPEMRSLVESYVREYVGGLTRSINEAYVNAMRIKSISVVDKKAQKDARKALLKSKVATARAEAVAPPDPAADGTDPATPGTPPQTDPAEKAASAAAEAAEIQATLRKEAAQDALEAILDASKADTRVFPELKRFLINHGVSYMAVSYDLGQELPRLHAMHPEGTIEVAEDGVVQYSGHRLPTLNGISRVNVWYPSGRVERCWCRAGDELSPDRWVVSEELRKTVTDEMGNPILGADGKPQLQPLALPVEGIPIFMARTSNEVEGHYGYGVARRVYGLIDAIGLMEGTSLAALLYLGFPYVVAMRKLAANPNGSVSVPYGASDQDLTAPKPAKTVGGGTEGTAPAPAAVASRKAQEAARALAKKGTDNTIKPGPGKVDEIYADEVEQIQGADVRNFLDREHSFLAQISDTVFVQFDNLLQGKDATSGVARRAKRQAFKDALARLAGELNASITDGLEYALARAGHPDFQVQIEFEALDFIDPIESIEIDNGRADWIAKIKAEPPEVRIDLLVASGMERGQAERWDAAWTKASKDAEVREQTNLDADMQLKKLAIQMKGGQSGAPQDDPAVPIA